MLVSFFVLQFINVLAEVYDEATIRASNEKSSGHIWHSYTFDTGTENREELQISTVAAKKNYTFEKEIYKWRSVQLREQVAILGAGPDFVLVMLYNNENDSYTSFKQEIQDIIVSVSIFKKWEAKTQTMRIFVLLGTCTENNYKLKWYQLESKQLAFLWDWPFHKIIYHADIVKINHGSKLLIVSHKKGVHKNPTADIYNFKISSHVDVWLFERVVLEDIPSTVTIFTVNDNTFLCAAFSTKNLIHVFKYSESHCPQTSDQKHFVSHQKIFTLGLQSLISFQVGFHWYLAIAGNISQIYKLGENLLFDSVGNLHLDTSSNTWLALPIGTYRGDVVLLCETNKEILVVLSTGKDNFLTIGNLNQMLCRNDKQCVKEFGEVSLSHSFGFYLDGHHNIIIPNKKGVPLFFKLFLKLKQLPDRVKLRLNEVESEQTFLGEEYENQRKALDSLTNLNKNVLENSDKNKASVSEVFSNVLHNNLSIKILSHTNGPKHVVTVINKLKSAIDFLVNEVKKLNTQLKSTTYSENEQSQSNYFPKNFTDGIIFYGDVIIEEIYLTLLNGHHSHYWLQNSFRKNKNVREIFGTKTVEKISVENILFKEIENNTAEYDIIFSDEPWEQENANIVNGNIKLKTNVHIVNNLVFSIEETTNNSSLFPYNRLVLALDDCNSCGVLYFEEMKINDELYVQGGINTRPIILPIHLIPLNINYLDVVNQARIELLNVKKLLEVDILNGRNFTQFVEQICCKRKLRLPQQNKSLKVVGVFSARNFQVSEINTINLLNRFRAFAPNDVKSNKSLTNSSETFFLGNATTISRLTEFKEENLETFHSERNIYVFQNIYVKGIILSEKINNLGWILLNDTVRKDEEVVNLGSIKKFPKPFSTKKGCITGTLGTRYVENVMNNFTNQLVQPFQIFNAVNITESFLEGDWNDISLKDLKQSLVCIPFMNAGATNLTFTEGFTLFSKLLNVTHSLNVVAIKQKNICNKEKVSFNENVQFKIAKITRMILNGSTLTKNGTSETSSHINNLNLIRSHLKRISLKFPQSVMQGIYHGNTTIVGNLNVPALNNVDILPGAKNNGGTKVIEKFLKGKLRRVKKLLVKGYTNTLNGINGMNLTKVVENGVSIKNQSFLNGSIVFENTIYFNDVNVTGSIDNFPLKSLEKNIVFKQSHIFLGGLKSFSAVDVTKDMKTRSLNGHLLQKLITCKGDQTTTGTLKINGNVFIQGNVSSYGFIKEFFVPEILKKFSTQFNSYIYSEDLEFRRTQIAINKLAIDGKIQKNSFDSTVNEALSKEGRIKVAGKKLFKGKTRFKENVLIQGLIQGVNFSKFFNNIVFTNEQEKVEGLITIKEAVMKNLEIADYFNSTTTNNFDTTDWLEDSVPLDRYEVLSGKKSFQHAYILGNAQVDFINGHLPTATISLRSKQYIPSLALFPTITATSDLSVSGLVNGINLMKEFEDSISVTGVQMSSGKMIYNKRFVVNGNLLVDSIKGKRTNDLLTIGTKQEITRNLDFRGSVVISHGVQTLKTLNSVKLRNWNEKTVLLNKPQTFVALWTVKGTLMTTKVEGKTKFNASSLLHVSNNVKESRTKAIRIRNETQFDFHSRCFAIKELSQQLTRLPYLFYQFEVAYVIETPSMIESVITFKVKTADYLIITFANECVSKLYEWDKGNSSFTYLREINLGTVNKWLVCYWNDVTYLITGSSTNVVVCEENLMQGNVWIFHNNTDKYEHVHTMNGFVDIIQDSITSGKFFTLEENGAVYQWNLDERKNIVPTLIANVGKGTYRFLDFKITEGLAVSNGKEIKHIRLPSKEVTQGSLPFPSGSIVVLTDYQKHLVGLVLKDKIVIFENITEGKVFSVIHSYKVGSVLWFGFGIRKQAFLIVASHHKLIEVYEYKSFVKRMSTQIFSSRLQSVELPTYHRHQLHKFVVVVQKRKIIFLEADMLGDFFQGNYTLC